MNVHATESSTFIVFVEPSTEGASEIKANLDERSDVTLETCTDFAAGIARVKESLPCMAIFSIVEANQIIPLVTALQGIKKVLKSGRVKVIVLSKIHSPQLASAMESLKVSEYLEEPQPARTLKFKTDLQIKAVDAIKKREAIEKASSEEFVLSNKSSDSNTNEASISSGSGEGKDYEVLEALKHPGSKQDYASSSYPVDEEGNTIELSSNEFFQTFADLGSDRRVWLNVGEYFVYFERITEMQIFAQLAEVLPLFVYQGSSMPEQLKNGYKFFNYLPQKIEQVDELPEVIANYFLEQNARLTQSAEQRAKHQQKIDALKEKQKQNINQQAEATSKQKSSEEKTSNEKSSDSSNGPSNGPSSDSSKGGRRNEENKQQNLADQRASSPVGSPDNDHAKNIASPAKSTSASTKATNDAEAKADANQETNSGVVSGSNAATASEANTNSAQANRQDSRTEAGRIPEKESEQVSAKEQARSLTDEKQEDLTNRSPDIAKKSNVEEGTNAQDKTTDQSPEEKAIEDQARETEATEKSDRSLADEKQPDKELDVGSDKDENEALDPEQFFANISKRLSKKSEGLDKFLDKQKKKSIAANKKGGSFALPLKARARTSSRDLARAASNDLAGDWLKRTLPLRLAVSDAIFVPQNVTKRAAQLARLIADDFENCRVTLINHLVENSGEALGCSDKKYDKGKIVKAKKGSETKAGYSCLLEPIVNLESKVTIGYIYVEKTKQRQGFSEYDKAYLASIADVISPYWQKTKHVVKGAA